MTRVPSARRIPTACKLQINILYYIYPCPVSEEPKESHFGGVWRSNPATFPNSSCNSSSLLGSERTLERNIPGKGVRNLRWRRRTRAPARFPLLRRFTA